MQKKKLRATRQLQCIAALPCNPNLDEDVTHLRQTYRIPVGEGAFEWFDTEHSAKYGARAYDLFMLERKNPWLRRLESITDTKVPLERDILVLVYRYGLPMRAFANVLCYALTDDKKCLHPGAFLPMVDCYLDIDKVGGLLVTVTGLSPWTTKKEWAAIWDFPVKQEAERAKRVYAEALGMAEPGKKRHTIESYVEQMQRYSEWYQLSGWTSEAQGLGPTKALEEWEKGHPDQAGRFDLSTLTHAVREFREIITPIPSDD